MRFLLLFLIPLLLLSKPFKVATYNVENLFDASFGGTEYEEYVPGKHNWNRRMVEIKLNHVAEVICDIDAAILGLQEIENEAIFQRLQRRLQKVGCGYPYSAITHKKGAPIQVALLSRYPIERTKEIEVSYAPKVRNILEARLKVQGHDLTLFVNHWKSKAYQGYESKRIAYAKALRARLARLSPKREYILLGDFNSDYNAYLTLEEKLDDTHGKTGFSTILQTQTEEFEILHAKGLKHYTLWKELPVEQRWSQKFYGKLSTPDQIVLPQKMFDAKGIDYVNNSFGVFKAGYLFTKRGYINRWRYKHGKHKAKGYSDHLPLFAYFDTVPYKAQKQTKSTNIMKEQSIAYLYTIDTLDSPCLLKNVTVVLKRGNSAVIKQSVEGRGVYLFGCAHGLHEGGRYDLRVESIKNYHGLKEITTAYVLKTYPDGNPQTYYMPFEKVLTKYAKQNEVVANIEGTYRHRRFYSHGIVLPIYFKKRDLTPPNGAKLKIAYAHLGYYKQLQLVIYSKKDFKIVE